VGKSYSSNYLRRVFMSERNGSREKATRVGCPGPIEVPTEAEREALMALKSIKERGRTLKKRIASLQGTNRPEGAATLLQMKEEMVELRTEWKRWEAKKQKAARERMVLLGHETVR
jgi:hypothetical protein